MTTDLKRRRPRARGERSAQMRAKAMLQGRKLPEYKALVVKLAARSYTHAENCSNLLFHLGETKPDDEPRLLIQRFSDLQKQFLDSLQYAFADEVDDSQDPLAALMKGGGQ